MSHLSDKEVAEGYVDQWNASLYVGVLVVQQKVSGLAVS